MQRHPGTKPREVKGARHSFWDGAYSPSFAFPAISRLRGRNPNARFLSRTQRPNGGSGAVLDAGLLEAAVQHAVAIHGHQDTPELRGQIRTAFRNGTPPA